MHVSEQKAGEVNVTMTQANPENLAECVAQMSDSERAAARYLIVLEDSAGNFSMLACGDPAQVLGMAKMGLEFAGERIDDHKTAGQLKAAGRLN